MDDSFIDEAIALLGTHPELDSSLQQFLRSTTGGPAEGVGATLVAALGPAWVRSLIEQGRTGGGFDDPTATFVGLSTLWASDDWGIFAGRYCNRRSS